MFISYLIYEMNIKTDKTILLFNSINIYQDLGQIECLIEYSNYFKR